MAYFRPKIDYFGHIFKDIDFKFVLLIYIKIDRQTKLEVNRTKNNHLAKTIREKVGLVEELSGAEQENIPRSLEGRTLKFIMDGGMLLHKTTWTIGLTFADICVQYLNVLSKFEDVTVIFDG